MRTDDPGRLPPSRNNIKFNGVSYTSQHEQQQSRHEEQPQWKWWLAGTGLVMAVLVVASLLSPWVRHEWALSLVRQNTPYTQLGFNDAAALPVTEVRGKGIPIFFAITNDEGKQIPYRYVVASGSGAKLESLSSGTETVAAGASWYVHVTVVPKCAETTCRVQVSLPQQGESIDFMFTYQSKSSTKKK
jgi:hypothetical protein